MQAFHQARSTTRLHQACSSSCAVSLNLQHSPRGSQRRVVPHAGAASMAASVEPSNSSALAIYSWPLKPALQQPMTRSPTKLWSTQMWFEAMVQTVVKQLDGGAFLLRVGVNPVLSLQLIRLDAADLAAGWDHIQQRHLSSPLQQDEAVILVHPVESADQPCVVRQTAGAACPGCPHTDGAASTAAAAAAAAAYSGGVTADYQASGAAELLHGQFGDCCSGGQDHHHHEGHSHHQAHTSSSSSSGPKQRQATQPDSQTAFYGLVVQTRDAADPLQGCYLLKTVKSSSSSSCHCTHYSLNQVCTGPSLRQQYQASWLV